MNDMQDKCGSLVSAALRHLRDAQHLLGPDDYKSLDQAYHLAGYAPECARKACLYVRWGDMALGHRFDEVGEDVLEVLLALDVRAHRYQPLDWGPRFPALREWIVSSRYWRTGTVGADTTRELVQQSEQAVLDIVTALWTDGALDEQMPE